MTATFKEASDEILAVYKSAWDTTGYPTDWENVSGDDTVTVPPVDGVTPWARVVVRNIVGGNESLTGALGKQRFIREGFFTAQIFTGLGKGKTEAYALAKVVADAFEGKSTPSGVWFRNARINEIGNDGSWYQVNFVVNFEYSEVK